MVLELKKFGAFLISHPSGREAWLVAQAYVLPELEKEKEIIVDFSGVNVLTPSWADEFLTPLKEKFSGRIKFLPASNASTTTTLEILSIDNTS